MKFQFITSVAAVLLSSGHGVFAAKEVRCWSSQSSDIPRGGRLLLHGSMWYTRSSVCLCVSCLCYALANTCHFIHAFFHLLSSLPTNTYHSPSPKTVNRKLMCIHAQGACLVYGLSWLLTTLWVILVVKRPIRAASWIGMVLLLLLPLHLASVSSWVLRLPIGHKPLCVSRLCLFPGKITRIWWIAVTLQLKPARTNLLIRLCKVVVSALTVKKSVVPVREQSMTCSDLRLWLKTTRWSLTKRRSSTTRTCPKTTRWIPMEKISTLLLLKMLKWNLMMRTSTPRREPTREPTRSSVKEATRILPGTRTKVRWQGMSLPRTRTKVRWQGMVELYYHYYYFPTYLA